LSAPNSNGARQNAFLQGRSPGRRSSRRAEAIAKFLGFKTSAVFYQVAKGELPVTRLGNRIIGSRTRLRQHFTIGEPKAGKPAASDPVA
jgi:hypothetical protein